MSLAPLGGNADPRELTAAWVAFSKNLFYSLSRKSGPDIAYRLDKDEDAPRMSEAQKQEAQAKDFEAAALRKGYADALRPLQDRFTTSKLTQSSTESWEIVFFILNAEFRPTPEALGKRVRKALGLPIESVEGHMAEAMKVVTSPQPSVLGIPATTVQAAYNGVAVPKHATRIEHIPARDKDGNLIGEGRRKFLLSMARMKDGKRPLPDAAELAMDEVDMTPMPKIEDTQEATQ
jgi:hypothetical protein